MPSTRNWSPLVMMIGLLTACSGVRNGDAARQQAQTGAHAAAGTYSTGIWSGTLTPSDSAQAPASGWLVIAADGSMHLDTDMALFTGATRTEGTTFTATATGHPYHGGFADGSRFTFTGMAVESTTLTGTWSGTGGGGAMSFHYEEGVSRQTAALSGIARTYESELWIGDATQLLRVTIAPDGRLNARARNGCTVKGGIRVADAARNRYQWTALLSGCASNGVVRGTGFMTGDSSIYFSGMLPGGPVWMGGMDEAATQVAGS